MLVMAKETICLIQWAEQLQAPQVLSWGDAKIDKAPPLRRALILLKSTDLLRSPSIRASPHSSTRPCNSWARQPLEPLGLDHIWVTPNPPPTLPPSHRALGKPEDLAWTTRVIVRTNTGKTQLVSEAQVTSLGHLATRCVPVSCATNTPNLVASSNNLSFFLVVL